MHGPGEQRGLDREDPVVGAGLGAREVQRGPDEHIPEAVDLVWVVDQACKRLVGVVGRIRFRIENARRATRIRPFSGRCE